MSLEDADLYCDSVQLDEDQWTVTTGSLWILEGELAGHYVVLSFQHYFAEELVYERAYDFSGYASDDPVSFGTKRPLADRPVDCTFQSRWAAGGMTVLGPIRIARVP